MKKLLLFFFLASPAWAAITYDNSSSTTSPDGSGISVWSLAVGGSNRLLSVSCMVQGSSATAVTYGGTSLTIATHSFSGTSDTSLWYLVNPPAGTATISPSWNTGSATGAICGAISLNGVDQNVPLDLAVGRVSSGTAVSVPITTTVTGDWIVDAVGQFTAGVGTSLTVGAGQTQRYNPSQGAMTAAGSTLVPASTTPGTSTPSWVLQSSQAWSGVAAAFSPFATIAPGQRSVISGIDFKWNATGTYINVDTTTYAPFADSSPGISLTFNVVESSETNVVPLAGTVDDFQMFISSALTGSQTWQWCIRRNKLPTGLCVNLSSSSPTGPTGIGMVSSNTVNVVSYQPGDQISVQSVPSGASISSPTIVSWSARFAANNTNQTLWMVSTTTQSVLSGVTNYQGIWSNPRTSYQIGQMNQIMPSSGTIKALYARIPSSRAAGSAISAFVNVNGSVSAASCTIVSPASACNITGLSVPLVINDLVSMGASALVSSSPITIGVEFDPTIDGESFGGYTPIQVHAANSTLYRAVIGGDQTSQDTELARQGVTIASTIRRLVSMAGNVSSWTAGTVTETLRKNNTNTSLTVSLTPGATVQDVTNSATFADGDMIDLKNVVGALTGNVVPNAEFVYFIPTPVAPTISAVYVSSLSVTYSTMVTSGYELDASTNSNFVPITASSTTTSPTLAALSFTTGQLNPNTTYYLQVGAIYSGTTGYANTSPASTSTLTNLLSSQSISSVSSNSITATWTAFAVGPGTNTCEGYQLDVSTASDFTGTVISSATTSFAANTLAVSGLAASTSYSVRSGAINYNSVPNYSVVGSTTTSAASGGGSSTPTKGTFSGGIILNGGIIFP